MKFARKSQIEHEHKAFQRSLEFFKQENALLKYRLSEMVDSTEENEFLQLAEFFQNELLIKDDTLNRLSKKLHQIFARFAALQNSPILPERFLSEQNRFRNELLEFEKKFLVLSKEFNEGMLQNT